MNLVKCYEFKVDAQLYFLEIIKNRIIINNKYEGIIILNYYLDLVKTIKIFDDLIIERCYKHFFDDTFLLFCFENNCFIYINKLWKFRIIQIEQNDEMFLSHLYWWKNTDEIILTSYKNEIFRLSLIEESLSKVTENYLKYHYIQFYKIWMDYKDVPVVRFFPEESVLLFQNKLETELIINNYIDTTERHISSFLKDTHDFYYQKGSVLAIHEKQVDLITPDNERFKIPTKNPWVSLRAKFIESKNICFVVLYRNESYPDNVKLISYCLKK